MSLLIVGIGVCAGPAQAQTAMQALPNPTPAESGVPHPVAVGQTFDWDLTIRNGSDPTLIGNIVVAPGAILLTPSCGAQNFFPPCTAPELDVFSFSATGIGSGTPTSCAQTFAINTITDASGNKKLQFTGTPVTLPPGGGECTIRFQATVLRAPTLDSNAAVGGTQTFSIGEVSGQVPVGQPGAGNTGSGTGTAELHLRAAPTIRTEATPTALVNSSLTDNATIEGLDNPQPGSTVNFLLFVTSDCSGEPIYSSLQPVTLTGSTGTANAAPYTPTTPGTYHWVAYYSGDAFNLPVSGNCNDANENSTVTTTDSPPPGSSSSPPPPPPPAAAVAAVNAVSPGKASLIAPSGCVTQNFFVQVSGSRIRRVVFTLDGKRVKALTRPNRGKRFVLAVRPGSLSRGTHRVVATTTFTAASKTRTRTLRAVFQRCARAASAVSPRFTG